MDRPGTPAALARAFLLPRPHPAALAALVEALRGAGQSYGRIARLLHVNRSTVLRWTSGATAPASGRAIVHARRLSRSLVESNTVRPSPVPPLRAHSIPPAVLRKAAEAAHASIPTAAPEGPPAVDNLRPTLRDVLAGRLALAVKEWHRREGAWPLEEEIVALAAKVGGVRPSDVTGPRRTARLVALRVAVALALSDLGVGPVGIAATIGRDHSTVCYLLHGRGRKGGAAC